MYYDEILVRRNLGKRFICEGEIYTVAKQQYVINDEVVSNELVLLSEDLEAITTKYRYLNIMGLHFKELELDIFEKGKKYIFNKYKFMLMTEDGEELTWIHEVHLKDVVVETLTKGRIYLDEELCDYYTVLPEWCDIMPE